MESTNYPSSVAVEPRVGIFWDYENCAPPANVPGYIVAEHIREVAHRFGPVSIFKAYLELSTANITPKMINLRSELQSSGVSLTDCPRASNRKDVVDKMLLVDMLTFAMDNPAPAVIMLISGDRDFVYAVSILRHRKYDVVLVIPPQGAHITLKRQATHVLEWKYDIFAEQNLHLHPDSGDNKLSSNSDVASSSSDGKKPSPTTPPRVMSPGGPPPDYGNSNGGGLFSPHNIRSPSIQQALPQTPPKKAYDLATGLQVYEMPTSPSPAPSSHRRTRSVATTPSVVTTPAAATTPRGPGRDPPRMFNSLVEILEEWRLLGNERPLRGQIAMAIVKKNPMLYARLGIKNFSDYVRAAEKAGVVKLGVTDVPGQDWIALADAYKDRVFPVYPELQSP